MSYDINLDSIFAFVGEDMPAASTRGVTGTVKPIPGKVIEMLDGEDRNVSRAGMKKFAYSIRGSDVWVPPFIGQWPGDEITVDLPILFVEPIGTPQQRPAVPGTLFYIDASRSAVVTEAEAAFRCYYPRAVCLVGTWTIDNDEDGAIATWTYDVKEKRVGGT